MKWLLRSLPLLGLLAVFGVYLFVKDAFHHLVLSQPAPTVTGAPECPAVATAPYPFGIVPLDTRLAGLEERLGLKISQVLIKVDALARDAAGAKEAVEAAREAVERLAVQVGPQVPPFVTAVRRGR